MNYINLIEAGILRLTQDWQENSGRSFWIVEDLLVSHCQLCSSAQGLA
jgi:hypothetical protein